MDPAKIEALINKVCQSVGGEWLLVGGSLVQIEYDGARGTEDIDLVPIRHSTLSDVRAQDELFKAAREIGLDAESVNSAARFFVGGLPGWQGEVLEWRRGSVGAVFKPSLALFIAMKLGRATESDLSDIQSAIRKEGPTAFSEMSFRKLVDASVQAKFDSLRSKFGL